MQFCWGGKFLGYRFLDTVCAENKNLNYFSKGVTVGNGLRALSQVARKSANLALDTKQSVTKQQLSVESTTSFMDKHWYSNLVDQAGSVPQNLLLWLFRC